MTKQLLPRRLTADGDWIPIWRLREHLEAHRPFWNGMLSVEECTCGKVVDREGEWEDHVMEEIG